MNKTIELIISLGNKKFQIKEDLINKSLSKIIKTAFNTEKINLNDYFFFKENDIININNENLSLEDILDEKESENNKVKLISFPKNQNIEKEDYLTKPSFKPDEIRSIICPKCQQYIIMEINDYKIFLSKCKNGHIFNNIYLQDFYSTQKYEEAKNLCSECELNHNIFRKSNDIHKIMHFYEILSNNDEYLEKLRNDLEKFRHK